MKNNQICDFVGMIGLVTAFIGFVMAFFGIGIGWGATGVGMATAGFSLMNYEGKEQWLGASNHADAFFTKEVDKLTSI